MTAASDGVYAYLQTLPGFTALAGDRVYPVVAPQEPVKPFVVYEEISLLPDRTVDGMLDRTRARIRFSCYSGSYTEAKAIARQIRLAFKDYKGAMGGTNVTDSGFLNEADIWEPDSELFGIAVDVSITSEDA